MIDSPFTILYILGIGLILLGKQKEADLIIETFQIEEFPSELRTFIKVILSMCAYAGSGNVVKIQELQQIISKKDTHAKIKQVAIIGMSLIALGEDIGSEMIQRSFNHFLQFGDVNIKKSISLALALLSVSNPKISVIDTLLKFVFDNNKEVAINSIFSLGIVASGTNNSKLSSNLRKIAASYAEESDVLSIVRLTQGLLNLGKGMVSLNPQFCNKILLSENALSGLLITLLSMTEGEGLIYGKYQYLLFSICLAMKPRMLMTLDSSLEIKPINVIIGQPIDVIGLGENHKGISGYQVNTTPLLFSADEKCEMNSEDFQSATTVLEDIVLIEEKVKER